MKKIKFGVYTRDCYGLSKEDKEQAFVKSFDEFREALSFAQKHTPNGAIHWREE